MSRSLVQIKKPSKAGGPAVVQQNVDVYSAFKAAHHLDRIQQLRDGGHPPPVHVHFILSDLCNQDCHFCAYRMSGYTSNELFADDSGNNNPNRRIPTEKAAALLREFAAMGVKAVEFTGGGEPTVHPDFPHLLELCLDLGMEAGVVTNGVLVQRRIPSELAARVSWWRVSIDAHDAPTYAAIRRTPDSHFRAATDAVKFLAHLNGPVVGAGYVVTPENHHGVYRGVELFRDLGAHNVRLSAMFNPDGARAYDGIYDTALGLVRQAVETFDDPPNFRIFQRFTEKIEDLQLGSPDYATCGFQRLVTYVGGDLNVYRCCVYAYNTHGLLGSIKDRSFAEFWNDPKTVAAFETFDARSCARCQFNDRNRFINYLTARNPAHAAFV